MSWYEVRSTPRTSVKNAILVLMCVNSMAYAEFYMTLARIVLTYDMELYNTTEKDIEIYHASIVGYPKKSRDPDFGQVIVKVTGRRTLATSPS